MPSPARSIASPPSASNVLFRMVTAVLLPWAVSGTEMPVPALVIRFEVISGPGTARSTRMPTETGAAVPPSAWPMALPTTRTTPASTKSTWIAVEAFPITLPCPGSSPPTIAPSPTIRTPVSRDAGAPSTSKPTTLPATIASVPPARIPVLHPPTTFPSPVVLSPPTRSAVPATSRQEIVKPWIASPRTATRSPNTCRPRYTPAVPSSNTPALRASIPTSLRVMAGSEVVAMVIVAGAAIGNTTASNSITIVSSLRSALTKVIAARSVHSSAWGHSAPASSSAALVTVTVTSACARAGFALGKSRTASVSARARMRPNASRRTFRSTARGSCGGVRGRAACEYAGAGRRAQGAR